ncbi:MAG: NAD(P)-dependent oxidoreductase [Candidatus Puniceispirillales bacterium]
MKIGFIGLGNVGSKIAKNLINNGFKLTVLDLDKTLSSSFEDMGAQWAASPKDLAVNSEMIITCLPSPKACSDVMEGEDGVLKGLSKGKIWAEMSTTDFEEVKRIGKLVSSASGEPMDCPVSGGCHRAATGNISIFAGTQRDTFEKALPVLKTMGRRILHTGDLGSASILKVATNYLATTNLISVSEALITCKAAGLNLNTTFEAFKISSGNSFVHETEGQVILNGSRDINFTMDLVLKDIGLFDEIAKKNKIPLEISPLINQIFEDGQLKYGPREWSPNIIKRLEDATGISVLAPGFPDEIVDDEEPKEGYEVIPTGT